MAENASDVRRKVFVSYKYNDGGVTELRVHDGRTTHVRDYVDLIEESILSGIAISKSEDTDEDLSTWTDEEIWEYLKPKIFDSSVTVVLISPRMKEPHKRQRDQWIPCEISYSLRRTKRKDDSSARNAVLAVVLPDRNGSYDYYKVGGLFKILRENINSGYVQVVCWDDFNGDPEACIEAAIDCKNATPEDEIKVNLT